MNWFSTFCRILGRDDMMLVDDQVPFSVGAEHSIAWNPLTFESRGPDNWQFDASSPDGLVATWTMRAYPDTRSVECCGSVRNSGTDTVSALRELWTFAVAIGLTESWGEPYVRTINGVRFFPNYYPPDDFRVVDRQLIRTPQVYTQLGGASLEDGRSSGRTLPCAVVSSEGGDRGFALFYEWSGLWTVGVTQQPSTDNRWPWPLRVQAGIWGLFLDLRPGESVPLPNLLITGFDGDLDAGCNALRRHIRQYVAPKLAGGEPLPATSFNHYFAFGNDFTAAQLTPAVEAAAEAGLEYFVVDAGWFPGGFRRGIGNWSRPDPAKFPEGLEPFADYVSSLGIKFGLWFEPEFAHVTSELFLKHRDWFLTGPHISPWSSPNDVHYPDGVRMTEVFDLGERFALLDFGLTEVQDWWISRIAEAYERWNVRWIRWDFNQPPRPYWDNAAESRRVGLNQIRHIEGLYRTLDEIMHAFPDLFIEQCASGGFRIDLGTVRRGHAFWMNDHTTHTDLVRAFQHGLNTVLPGIYANTNLCQHRFDYSDYDYLSHGGGSFGFSGRLWEASRSDFEQFAAAVARFKTYRHLLAGDYHRPTGNPQRRTDYANVRWSNGEEVLEMEFNPIDHVGTATIQLRSPHYDFRAVGSVRR
jgi:hypothetical protein